MKFAINNWVYADEALKTTFSRLRRYGYDGVELKGEPSQYSVSEIRRLCHEFELDVTSILGWCIYGIPGRDLSSPDEKERLAAIHYSHECVDFAAAVGAPVLIVLPVPAGRTFPTGHPDTEAGWLSASRQEWVNAVDSVRKTAVYAANKGIRLAIEPINRYETYLITTIDDVLRFVTEVGESNVGVNLDTFHMNIDEADPAAAIRKAGRLLIHMHAADSNRESPGRGHTDFTAIMSALREVNFDGALVLEPVPPGADPGMAIQMAQYLPLRDKYAEESIQYLKKIESSLLGK